MPESAGDAKGAFRPSAVATLAAKLASSLMASASSLRVSRAPGAPPMRLVIAACTKAVVDNCVVLVPAVAVGAVGVPVSAGLAMLALRAVAEAALEATRASAVA